MLPPQQVPPATHKVCEDIAWWKLCPVNEPMVLMYAGNHLVAADRDRSRLDSMKIFYVLPQHSFLITGWFLPHTKLLLILDIIYTAVALQGILFHTHNSTIFCFLTCIRQP